MSQLIKVGDNFIDAILDPECLEEVGTIKACWVGKLITCEDEADVVNGLDL